MSRALVVLLLTILVGPQRLGFGAPDRPAVPLSALWEMPTDLGARDLFNGPWGPNNAPDPTARYTFVRVKSSGVNPGVVVRDPRGRIWHVKQARDDKRGAEGPVEVTLSRVLSAVGYHQPPVYFLPSFTMTDGSDTHLEAGGRFRLDEPTLHDRGSWSLRDNPFAGTRAYRGLLVILLMFNSWDLKNSNNTLYDVHLADRIDQWYVVRDLGGALGATGRIAVRRNNLEAFERHDWIRKVADDYVVFRYGGWRPELVRRISIEDLEWACELMGGLSERQWRDAFRAGGYPPEIADRFIRKLRANIEEGRQIARSRRLPSFRKSNRD